MNATTVRPGRELAATVAIDLAKQVFELAFADGNGWIIERKRLGRGPFQGCLINRPPLRVIMEACGSAHYGARRLWPGSGIPWSCCRRTISGPTVSSP